MKGEKPTSAAVWPRATAAESAPSGGHAAHTLHHATDKVSIVIPLYNEGENIGPLYRALCESLDPADFAFEIIFVDDGSTDDTADQLRGLVDNDRRVRAICLSRNYGQTIATGAGIELVRGSIVVTLDGDLQNDPRDIPQMVEKIREGYDLVTGWRRDRKDPFLSRRLPSKAANWLIRRITGVATHDIGCALRAVRTDLICRLPFYSDLHRFIPAMCMMFNGRHAEVVVRHHPRRRGTSKYGLGRIGRVLFDMLTVKMLTSSAFRPLRWFGRWALICFLLAMLEAGYTLCLLLVGKPGSTSGVPIVTILTVALGVHLVMAGFLGELVIWLELKVPPDERDSLFIGHPYLLRKGCAGDGDSSAVRPRTDEAGGALGADRCHSGRLAERREGDRPADRGEQRLL